jgi:hypothetical protein
MVSGRTASLIDAIYDDDVRAVDAAEPQNMNATKTASQRPNAEEASRNLVSISPFFIVKDLQASIA